MAKTITRKNVVTKCAVSIIDRQSHAITQDDIILNGYLSEADAMEVLLDYSSNTSYLPLNIDSIEYSVQTRGMDYDRWNEVSEIYAEDPVTEDEAAAFGKRAKTDKVESEETAEIAD